MSTDNTGLLIIRAYVERDSSAPLRAEIRLTSDVSAGIERTLVLADADVVARLVRSWLDDILNGPTADSGRHAGITRP
ncbi:MAG: hypothetical protein DLM67_19800 [Candidatus Nephthysia bennettiae]|uniref:Uncharacterized protein n=1 Tax=Candidatus Nephthysia bennettiae TaxID=3127016 RepID=A0A934K6R1_9BACT|nr:hypothetical protein [Candidatus Dormibacteraeota bacterium]MBJ7611889.1 hypothetical protein [Candidatus Dormibacteraeota bacterium]PZR88995.1 MAG: hypothetical protein DLM67_19800 [Candidatus Dormibacteraeota bacterium]